MRTPRILIFASALSLALLALGAQAQSFDDVWLIMTQEAGPESPGCRGCHIQPLPPQGLIWGDTEDEVLCSLQTPDASGHSIVENGNYGSKLSYRLECGTMPFGGRQWHEGPDDPDHPDEFFQYQLEKLRAFLSQFDDPTQPPTTCQ
jgi:hypothetical protein